MTPPSSAFSSATPAPAPGGKLTSVRAALHAGLLVGFMIGCVDALQILAAHGMPFGFGAYLQSAAQGIAVYVAVFWAVALVLTPLVHVGFGRESLGVRARHAFAFTVTIAVFMELFWHSRSFVFPGRPATSPERMFAAFVMFVACWALGTLLSRTIARRGKLFRGLLEGAAWLGLVLGMGGFLFGASGPGLRGELNKRNEELPNVLLVIVDALRADVIGAYGNEQVKTPVMDELAAQGVLFENTQAQAPFTWTSFGSILTGKYPRRHGLMKMKPGVVMAPNETLAWHLKKAVIEGGGGSLEPSDFATGTFMTGMLSQGSGLMRGFDVYFEAMAGHELVDKEIAWSVYRSDLMLFKFKNKITQRFDSSLVVSTARDWLREHKGRRFLSMVHLYSTHTPYDPEPEFREMYVDPDYDGPVKAFYAEHRIAIEQWDRGEVDEDGKRLGYETTPADAEQIRNLYYAGVSQADAAIGDVLDELRLSGALDNTLVVITSDHGEELGEHGLWEHNWMYETNLQIPLIMFWPKGLAQGVRVPDLVETIDIVPTICDLMGLVEPNDAADPERGFVDGHSLVPLTLGQKFTGDEWDGFAFAENGKYISIRDREWKLVVKRDGLGPGAFAEDSLPDSKVGRRARLFKLTGDRGELSDLWRTPALQEANRAECERLLGLLRKWSDSMPIAISLVDESHRDHESEALMGHLGYADGVGDEDEEQPANGDSE